MKDSNQKCGKMGKRWQQKRKNEHFYKKAKKEGYRGRAAYKLKQLNDKYDLLKPGDAVLDLGSAPGSWLQVAREIVGEEGFVLGVDLEPIENLDRENVKTIQADITDSKTSEVIQKNIPRPPNVILSDASPNISGIWDVDHARSVGLARAALNLSSELLQPGGNVLIKVFQGEIFNDFLKEVKRTFDFCKASEPKASRKESAETYVVGRGFSPY